MLATTMCTINELFLSYATLSAVRTLILFALRRGEVVDSATRMSSMRRKIEIMAPVDWIFLRKNP